MVESASRDVFRFSRTGDKDWGEDGEARPCSFVSSAISNFVKTFLSGGRDAGLGLTPSSSEVPVDIARPRVRSSVSCGECMEV